MVEVRQNERDPFRLIRTYFAGISVLVQLPETPISKRLNYRRMHRMVDQGACGRDRVARVGPLTVER